MALWKDSNPTPAASPATNFAPPPAVPADRLNVASLSPQAPPRRERADGRESVIASDLTIEGKIVGSGHVRIAGRFKGDIHVEGNLIIESGANLDGQVRASVVTVAGELRGNIESAKRVELIEGGVISGDVKAGSLTVAAGSRMRGQVEFGWEDEAKKSLPDAKGYGVSK